MVEALMGVEASFPQTYLNVLTQACGAAAVADPARARTCGDLTVNLVERGRSVMGAAVGGRIAERIAGTDERLLAVRDKADAMRWQQWQAQIPLKSEEVNLLSCDSLQRFHQRLSVQAQIGENQQTLQELAASGVTIPQAAQRWRAFMSARSGTASERPPAASASP
jgi:uncharacterized protein YmfQ (DUF2313 family)